MKSNLISQATGPARAIVCALALAFCVTAAPATSHALETAANAKIQNVVTVTYYDATGTNQHLAATSTSVTVNLVQAALTASTLANFPAAVDSGQPSTSYVALTSNANGSDNYTLTLTEATVANLSGHPYTLNLVTDTSGAGASAITSGTSGNVTLGASSIVSIDAVSGTSQKIWIPAGTLNGIAVGSIVVIGGNSYIVSDVDNGTQANYGITGTSTTTSASPVAESLGYITIVKDTNTGGTGSVPNLTAGASLAGTLIEQRKLLQITITGTVNSNTANGTDLIHIDSNTTTGTNNSTQLGETATFNFVSVSITKIVHNITDSSKDVAGNLSATGKPGDVLEYTVTVNNGSTGNAGKVSVADAVPSYTTLVTGSQASYPFSGGGANFATITDSSANTVIITTAVDPETQPGGGTVGFGDAGTVAGNAIHFFIGTDTTTSALGGTVAAGATYTIKYRVKIN
jgi:uncharacterized repeat protein (TIGR01451 family)